MGYTIYNISIIVIPKCMANMMCIVLATYEMCIAECACVCVRVDCVSVIVIIIICDGDTKMMFYYVNDVWLEMRRLMFVSRTLCFHVAIAAGLVVFSFSSLLLLLLLVLFLYYNLNAFV